MIPNDFDGAVATGDIDAIDAMLPDDAIFPAVAAAIEQEVATISDVGRPYAVGRVKRVLDVVVASVALVVFLPFMAIVYAAVRLTSRGPGIFVQARAGLDGKPFRILKFRSMHVAGPDQRFRQACRGDLRVTPIGRFLRKYSIDELPQILNVLAGHMSLVGPRPHAVEHEAACAEEIVGYGRRLRTKPGITGLAQVRGHRGETPDAAAMQARIDHDLEYVATASLSLDVRIIAATAYEVVRSKNVY